LVFRPSAQRNFFQVPDVWAMQGSQVGRSARINFVDVRQSAQGNFFVVRPSAQRNFFVVRPNAQRNFFVVRPNTQRNDFVVGPNDYLFWSCIRLKGSKPNPGRSGVASDTMPRNWVGGFRHQARSNGQNSAGAFSM